jgi:hypothetical protein
MVQSRRPAFIVTAGLDPAIHVFVTNEDVDARIKSAHDAAELVVRRCGIVGWIELVRDDFTIRVEQRS